MLCVLRVLQRLLCVVCCLLFAVCWLSVVVWYVLSGVCCSLFVFAVWCLLCAVHYCVWVFVCCLISVVCYVLVVICGNLI